MADRNRAKQIITEIIRIAGTVKTKTHLHKMFYFAHLWYAKREPDYLSDWPIVRMPRGPGIEGADALLHELIAEGTIEARTVSIGPHSATEYRTLGDEIPDSLSPEAIDAIREAVVFAKEKTAAELSEITHEYSHSWQESEDGSELNIYVDLLADDEYEAMKARMQQNISDLRAIGEL